MSNIHRIALIKGLLLHPKVGIISMKGNVRTVYAIVEFTAKLSVRCTFKAELAAIVK